MAVVESVRIDLNDINADNLKLYLKLFGLHRYVKYNWIDPARQQDPRVPEDFVSDVPAQLFPSVIVPEPYFDKTMFLIKQTTLESILEHLDTHSIAHRMRQWIINDGTLEGAQAIAELALMQKEEVQKHVPR